MPPLNYFNNISMCKIYFGMLVIIVYKILVWFKYMCYNNKNNNTLFIEGVNLWEI